QLVAGAAEVIHDLLRPALDDGLADAAADVVEHLVPGHALPLATAALAHTPQRIANALGVLDRVQRGRALGAVAAAAARVHRVALELLDLQRLLIDVGEQAARRLAVEADRRDERVATLDLLGPGDRIVFL